MSRAARTQAEILTRIKEVEADDFFGFQRGDLVDFLDYENAKPFLKDGVTAEHWAEQHTKRTATECVLDYLPFGWEKANDQRGLSASRSVEHLKAWLWLAGYDDASDVFDDVYEYYGKPCLVVASEIIGFDWASHDDGCWTNSEGSDSIGSSCRDTLVAEMKAKAENLRRSSVAA